MLPYMGLVQKLIQWIPTRGKGRLADAIWGRSAAEMKCQPLPGVAVHLRASQRIERLMWAGAYEVDLVRLMKQTLKPGMCVLDVGANIGYLSAIAAGLVTAAGQVHAFEPSADCWPRLQLNLAAFPWATAYNTALSDRPGTGTLHGNTAESGWSSLMGAEGLDQAAPVKVDMLDEWIERNKIERVDFIKIDVEGSEYRVLTGALKALKRFQPVIVAELNEPCLARDGRKPQDVIVLLNGTGYRTRVFGDGIVAER